MNFTLTVFLFLFSINLLMGQQLFWTDAFVATITKSDRNGGNKADLTPNNVGQPYGVAFDHIERMLYITDQGDSFFEEDPKIYRMNEDGSNVMVIITDIGEPQGIAIDEENRKIYWTEPSEAIVKRANLDGSNIETILTFDDFEFAYSITLDVPNNRLFLTDSGNERILTTDLDGNNLMLFPEDSFNTMDYRDIVYNSIDDKVYWIGGGSVFGDPESRIFRANADGSGLEEDFILLGSDNIDGIEIDTANQKIIWANLVDDMIYEANFDGSGIEAIASFEGQVRGIALDYGVMSPTIQFEKITIDVQITPNPATELVTVQLTNQSTIQLTKLVLYDLAGKKMQELKTANSQYAEMPLQQLAPQIYWLKIELSNGQTIAQKVQVTQ